MNDIAIELYVDGSYSKATPHQTYGGIVVALNNKAKLGLRVIIREKELVSMWNVGGELSAAICGLKLVSDIIEQEHMEDIPMDLHVFYDYEGIYRFIDKKKPWAARKLGARMYVDAYNTFIKQHPNLNIEFTKVKAHSGILYNELADKIAAGEPISEEGFTLLPPAEV